MSCNSVIYVIAVIIFNHSFVILPEAIADKLGSFTLNSASTIGDQIKNKIKTINIMNEVCGMLFSKIISANYC